MKRLLAFLGKHGASDLHLKVGYPPYVRIGGYLRQLQIAADCRHRPHDRNDSSACAEQSLD